MLSPVWFLNVNAIFVSIVARYVLSMNFSLSEMILFILLFVFLFTLTASHTIVLIQELTNPFENPVKLYHKTYASTST